MGIVLKHSPKIWGVPSKTGKRSKIWQNSRQLDTVIMNTAGTEQNTECKIQNTKWHSKLQSLPHTTT